MSTTDAAVVKPVRKFPPPCWTRDEALVLIEAYRERWYALHRAFLKNPDWDAVAEKVTTACPDVTPPKTSAQCRHKMEKLRQRHRAEKQRASAFPGGRFFSSWFYFEAMEAMENNNGSNTDPTNNNPNNSEIINGVPLSDHRSLNPGRGIRFKPSAVQNLVTLAASSTNHTPDLDSRVSNHNSPYMNNNNNWVSNPNQEHEDGFLIEPIIKNHIRIKPSIQEHNPRKFSKVGLGLGQGHDHQVDENGEMWIKVSRNNNNNNNTGFNEERGGPDLKQGKKRVVHEVVSSIKVLGDGFMKMEKMKIEMVREIERMRVEAEMKRNQLILESQKQIVEVFLKGLIEIRK